MLAKPEEILDKPITHALTEQLLMDLIMAPAHRVLILMQTQARKEPLMETIGKIGTVEDQKHVPHEKATTYIREIYKQEGILGFWKGAPYDIIRGMIYRLTRSVFIHLYEPLIRIDDTTRNSFRRLAQEFLLFCAVEFSRQLLQHPYRVIRVRISALEHPTDPSKPRGFRKLSSCIRKIMMEDGIMGFYRGFGTSMLEAMSNVLYLTAQRFIVDKYVSDAEEDTSILGNLAEVASERSTSSVINAVMSTSSAARGLRRQLKTLVFRSIRKLGHLLIFYPLRVLERRFIMRKGELRVQRNSATELIKEMWRREGLMGFYSGLKTQMFIDFGTMAVQPFVSNLTDSLIPDVVAEKSPNIGDINEAVEDKIVEVRDAAFEQVVRIVPKNDTSEAK